MSDEKEKPPKVAETVGWDIGAGAIRIANIDTRYRPEPQLITSQMDDRHFLSMTCMRVPQAFHRSTLFNTPVHIIMDAFRCTPTKSRCLFCVERINDCYEIPSQRRLMKNNPTPEDLRENGIPENSQTFTHVEIMTTIIREVSKSFGIRNVFQKAAYICIPDAASFEYIQKLQKAFIEVFSQRKSPDSKEAIQANNGNSLTLENIHFIQRTAAATQMYFHRRSGIKVYEHNREQFHRENRKIPPIPEILPRTIVVIAFGAGHWSSAIYQQQFFERYGIRHHFSQSDASLGGEDLCYRLCEYIVKHKKLSEEEQKALKGNKRLLKFLRNTMDQAKIDLSGFTPAIVDVEVNDDKVITIEISRDDFENIIAKDEFERIEKYITALKEHAKEKNLDLTDILLVQGSTRTKKVITLIEHHFPNIPIVKCLNTDECVVMGTALKGALRDGIHRTAYAEVEDIAIRDEWVEIDGRIKLYLTKEFESVQNSKEYWIKPLGTHRLTYNGHHLDVSNKFTWKKNVSCDPRVMTNYLINDDAIIAK